MSHRIYVPKEARVASTADREAILAGILKNPQLPSPPNFALEIVKKTREAECSVDQLTELISRDPGLCGKLFKTINSVLYGLSQPVTSLSRAVLFLGFRALRSLVLGLALPAMQSTLKVDQGMRNFWMGLVTGAMMAQELGRRMRCPCPEDEMVTSLLRDVGMMVLNHALGREYAPVWDSADLSGNEQCEWEEMKLGVDHACVSAALLQQWGLPAEIVEPIRYHHFPERAAGLGGVIKRRAEMVAFTSQLAHLGNLPADSEYFEEVLHKSESCFNMNHDELRVFVDEVRERVGHFATILNVDVGSVPDFAAILAAGCEELVFLSTEQARTQVQRALQPARESRPSGLSLPKTDEIPQPEGKPVLRFSEEFFDYLEQPNARARFDEFEVERLLGRGSMGVVVLAFDTRTGQRFAIKILSPSLTDNKKALQRFALEGRYAGTLRHENVVPIYSVGEFAGTPYLVMEYVDGKSLQEHLDNNRVFQPSEIIRIGHEAALGIAAAHHMRLIHRDIKPGNILLEEINQRARLTDFGLVRVMDLSLNISIKGYLVGTPMFMSPEQIDGLPLTPASDLFSLGSVLYTLCTSQPPFGGDTMTGLMNAIVTEDPAPVAARNPAIPGWLCRVIDRLLAKSPADRFPSATVVASELGRHVSHF